MGCQAEECHIPYGEAIEDSQPDTKGKVQESTVVPLLRESSGFYTLELAESAAGSAAI